MRKVLSLAFAVCMTLLLTVPAFADGRGPAFTEYDVVCTKDTPYYRENWEKDGAWEQVGTFPDGTTLKVDYEYEKDGVLYGDVRVGSGEEAEWVYIRLSDVELKNDIYLPENAQKLSRSHSVRVIAKGGVSMYAGPNKKYDKLVTIPRGTKLTYEYGNDEDDYYRTWAYVSYLGKDGWIYVYSSDTKNGLAELPEPNRKAEIWVLEDGVQLFSGISFGNMENELGNNYGVEVIRENHEEPDRVVDTLEKGEKYTYRMSHGQEFGTWYYIASGLRAGWVFMSNENSRIAATPNRAERDSYMAFRSFKLTLREEPRQNANGKTVSVAKDTVLPADYKARKEYNEFFYATIDGKSGWYSRQDVGSICAYKVNNTYGGYANRNKSAEDAPIYSDIVAEGKTVGKIPAGSLFTPLYYGDYETQIDEENSEWTYFYYVRYNGVTGWVKEEDLWDPNAEESETAPEEMLEDDEAWTEDEYPIDEEWDEDAAEEDAAEADDAGTAKTGLSPRQIVLACVAGAAVLALTAAVTLVLIRRKRKSKALPPKPVVASEPAAEPDDEEQPESADDEAAPESEAEDEAQPEETADAE